MASVPHPHRQGLQLAGPWREVGKVGSRMGVGKGETERLLGRDSLQARSAPILTASLLLCSQKNKVPAGPAPDATGGAGASDEWVFDKKVSAADGGLRLVGLLSFSAHTVSTLQ